METTQSTVELSLQQTLPNIYNKIRVKSIKQKHGRIAFIATPLFRVENYELLQDFVFKYMYSLCYSFNVLITKDTYDCVVKILEEPSLKGIRYGKNFQRIAEDGFSLHQWINVIKDGLESTDDDFIGTTHIAFELIEQRLDAIIHLMSWQDKFSKPDSDVLSREANVHNVPIAMELDTAIAFVRAWNSILNDGLKVPRIFLKRARYINPPLNGLTKRDRILAMIANDNMKLEICRFAVENADYIFKHFDYILATGTTGIWIKKFMVAAKREKKEIEKIRICNSGPLGGDIQIAYAIEKGLCHKIIFLQDPSTIHPHESDIKFFEKAVTSENVHIELATNIEAAKILIHG